MRHVQRQAFRRADGGERRFDIAGNAEIAAMHMQGMDDAELLQRARQRHDDLPRRHVVVDMLLVEIELALIELEGADAAGIDHLDGDRLRRMHGPGDVVLDALELLLGRELAQKIIVAAEHDEGAFVDHRRVAHLHMRLARIGGQHGRLEAGGVAHLGIAISGDHGRRHRVARPGAGESGALDLVLHVVLGDHHAGDGHLAAADMGVRVDGAGHHHPALHVVVLRHAPVGRRGHDLSVLDIDVADLAAHFVGGVIDFAAGKLDRHCEETPGLYSAASMAASTSAARGSSARCRFFRGSDTTLSQRTSRPA